jgi:mono/diheme cytochrome c family protein
VPFPVCAYRRPRRNRALRGGIVIFVATAALAGHTQNAPAPTAPAPAATAPAATATNVPDVVTRKTGLRVEPMARPARIYAENCEGCHGWAGVSVTEIPTLKGRIGYFARIPEGRRYLVQVPNVALNPSSDEDIAAMMNWLLATFSREQLPADFVPYTAQEVAALRTARIDVAADRRRVVAALVAAKELPSPDVLSNPHASLY